MDHEFYMQRCLQLAKQGMPLARPNPLVGCVIAHKNKIIGEGFHKEYGGPHAEVNAVNSVMDPSLLPLSTIYVSLEPCAHFGKTPPCADLIIKHNIQQVVISCIDTFSEVAGKGIQRLKDAGVDVITGILENEGRELNKRFFTFHEQKRPYIILKWAQTPDGFIDKPRTQGETGIRWITGAETKQLVHQWRSEEMGILVGHNTWINDRPALTVREVEGKNPVRIIWSFSSTEELGLNSGDLVVSGNVHQILEECYSKGIQSVFVEGGAKTLQQFMDSGLWDEARIFHGNVNFNEGIKAPVIDAKQSSRTELPGGDLLYTYIR